MGIFDEIGNDEDELPQWHDADAQPAAWRTMDAPTLLRAERAGASAALVAIGALGARLEALSPAAREAWALLNLDRTLRRILASATLEPADLLPHLLGGAPLPVGNGEAAARARFLLCALLPLLANAPGADGRMAARFLERLRPAGLTGYEQSLWQEEQAAIDTVSAIVQSVQQLLETQLASCDPLFGITDFLATYGAALHGFALHHLPDNNAATQRDMLVESFRQARGLPGVLYEARRAVPEGSLLSVVDLGVSTCLLKRLAPMPPLTGLIRRDLFRRDLHYPADFGSLIAAIKASTALARRDLELVTAWETVCSRRAARVQLLSLTLLSCIASARPSALQIIVGTSWQGLETAMVPLIRAGVVHRDAGIWSLAARPDRD